MNITCFGSDGPEFGVTFPKVTDATDEKACHITQTVSDDNLDAVTLKGEPAISVITLNGKQGSHLHHCGKDRTKMPPAGRYNLKPLVGKMLSKEELAETAACMILLFHGTDMALLQMTQDERAVLREDCGSVIDYLLPVYINGGFENLSSQDKCEILGTVYVPVINVF